MPARTALPAHPPRWLVKTEPSAYSFDDLVREGRCAWTGVKNALAQQHLQRMAQGDAVLVYHTGGVKAVVGLARVVRAPYPDPTAPGTAQRCVDLAPVAALPAPVPLAALKGEPALQGWELITISRLSVMPVPEAAWRLVHGPRGRAPR